MSKNHVSQPKGLILLVVLGMLALFSLLAVTYVVFASQSRASSVALARHSIRDGKNKNPLFEEAIKQLIRGTAEPTSAVYGHDLLGDLYGDRESLPAAIPDITIRSRQFSPNGGADSPMSYVAASSHQRPMLLGGSYANGGLPGKFLRIPLDPINYATPVGLPIEHDALTGRVVTFLDGHGPLGGQSFRIVRYIGQMPFKSGMSAQELFEFSQCYSIVIDLSEADFSKAYSTRDAVTGTLITRNLAEWAQLFPPVINTSTWASGLYLCYENVSLDPTNRLVSGGYKLFINAAPVNTHGVGILNDGSSQMHVLKTSPMDPIFNTEVNAMPVGLQTRYQNLATTGTLTDPRTGGTTIDVLGDSDEPYDAPDYQNLYLSSKETGATTESDIIPSFHRPALINYIVNWKDPATYTEEEFRATLRRIELVVGRPLAINVTTPTMGNYIVHPTFTGSNPGRIPLPASPLTTSSPSLILNVPAPWSSNWPVARSEFTKWLNFLTVGPWDVDNDGDSIKDGMWLDLGMPLQSTSDGKLLKALVSYYVADLDNKIDVNAAGSAVQSNVAGLYGQPTTTPPTATPPIPYARGYNQYFSQGLGYGPADLSFRHLFGKSGLQWNGFSGRDAAEVAYRDFMGERYSRSSAVTEFSPGDTGEDDLSLMLTREKRQFYRHGSLPGLPSGVFGRVSLGLDRLGSPFMHNVDATMDELTDDPYESRLITSPYKDRPFSLSEWERVYRVSDSDRSALSMRLEQAFGEDSSSISQSSLRDEVTTISRNLRIPMLAQRGQAPTSLAPTSLFQVVNTIRELKSQTPLTPLAFGKLFPLEFHRGQPFNINRPFGNGVDDNGDGEIDEPTEVYLGQLAKYGIDSSGNLVNSGAPEDYVHEKYPGDTSLLDIVEPQVYPNTIFRGNETRQLYARHLYCLAQLIVPADYVFPNVDRAYFLKLQELANSNTELTATVDLAANKLREIRGRTLAQWAVNVVDFRDSDSTMTRFAYDNDPFLNDAGLVDFTWTPDDGVVWGLEQPELLLTESLAMHDIRVRKAPGVTPARFDQVRIPEGSLFLELYCPRSTQTGTTAGNTPLLPGVATSLYTANAGGDVVLDVSKITSDYSGVGITERFPVWRVYLSNPVDKNSSSGPDIKTPAERLRAPLVAPSSTLSVGTVTRSDLTYQLPSSNQLYNSAANAFQPPLATISLNNGLVLDHAVDLAQRIADPDPEQSRVIVFANGFTPSSTNTPGVKDADSQVFVNKDASVLLHGNQYLVVGPRDVTYFGSSKAAASGPDNAPNPHRIELNGSWVDVYKPDGSLIVDRTARPGVIKDCVTMVAAAEIPLTTWSMPVHPTVNEIGLNVSEPLSNDTDYYDVPTDYLNSGDTTADPTTGAPGFGNAPADAYNDLGMNPVPPTGLAPFDDGLAGPLARWDLDHNGIADTIDLAGRNVVKPGTQLDFCTAYLQRLADPDKPWDATFNPYITVDWIPIDLTVFSGEDDSSEITTADQDPYLVTRQKAGQTLDSQSLSFNLATTAPRGQTFLSSLTDAPKDPSNPSSTTSNFFEFELPGDEIAGAGRPSSVDGTGAFSTLGFLNSTFVLAAEDSSLIGKGLPAFPPQYIGSPGDPNPTAASRRVDWHPDSVFWANRSFVNTMELAFVPLSAPGQFMQEFSGTLAPTVNSSMYGPSYSNEETATNLPHDPRMPTRPVSAKLGVGWPPVAPDNPYKARENTPTVFTLPGSPDDKDDYAYTPFSHLLNFYQEVPELPVKNPMAPVDARFPKNSPLALLLDLVETPSPWVDANSFENPNSVAMTNLSAVTGDYLGVAAAANIALAPLRAPYNKISRFVEPGRINLNTVREPNVFQALWSNSLTPSDVDFPPYAPITPFGGIEDIDHNKNGILDLGERATPQPSLAAWDLIKRSRQGFEPIAGFFNPGGSTTYRFNPHFPTEFAGVFKPASEAGMVPYTRNPISVNPGSPAELRKLHALATNRGVLDLQASVAPAHVTLMRGNNDTPVAAGIQKFTESPLVFADPAAFPQRHVFTDRYPLTRLVNLTSNRSNVFAVYVTIGLFEYDEATGNIGIEYGTDKGEMERFKAFYIIDRTVPVGFRTGEDHNIEKTILVRRYLNN